MPDLGLQVRAGLHTGECELVDGKPAGIAVNIGARVASYAGAGEVLVSQTVKDLVAGSGLDFDERGARELKGVPGNGGSAPSPTPRLELRAHLVQQREERGRRAERIPASLRRTATIGRRGGVLSASSTIRKRPLRTS